MIELSEKAETYRRNSVHLLKCTPIWDALGCGGMTREGGGTQRSVDLESGRAKAKPPAMLESSLTPLNAGFGILLQAHTWLTPADRAQLRIDLHYVKGLAHHVELGDAGSKGVCGGIEDIEFRALNDVNNGAAGNRLEAGHVKVLAEG